MRKSICNFIQPVSPTSRKKQVVRRGLTLVELMVVVGVIAIVVAIALPAIARAREAGREVVCMGHQRQIAAAFISFAADHRGRLPGNWWDYQNADTSKRSWLINADQTFAQAPQCGTIWKYVKNAEVYRCPSYEVNALGANGGSNGKFDYASFLLFSGARLADVQTEAKFTYPDSRIDVGLPVPLICEEEPQGGINGGNIEGGHCSTDRIAHIHRGGGYYAATDGSVHWFREPLECTSWNWMVRTPTSKWQSLGQVPIPTWGWWDGR